MTASLPMPWHRTFVLLIALSLALGALVPAFSPQPTRAASSSVVISQVYGGGGNAGAFYTHDFIELFNLGAVAVDVSTWSVQYAAPTGTSWQRTNLTGSIAPGGYYLVQQAAGAGGTTPLPTPDATGGIAMGGAAGKVALVSNQTTLPACGAPPTSCLPNASIADYVGYGTTATDFEGTGPTAATSNTTSAHRTNRCMDLDNNAPEFSIAPPIPRNSTTLAPCGSPTNPTGTGAADPSSALPGATTRLTVTVAPGANPTSTGLAVTADLSPIGGSATQAFSDDGLTGGDTTAADNVFTWTATVATGTTPGAKTLAASITDGQSRTGSASINFIVEGPPSEIWEIQGASHLSSYDDEMVFGVQGVVTAIRNGTSGGFWMTDPTPDAGPGSDATSNGIFVFSPGTQTLLPGTLVRVHGTVDEFRPGGSGSTNLTTTQIVSPTTTVLSTGNALPTTIIGVDRVPPGLVIDNDSTSTVEAAGAIFDPTEDGIDFWESLEGMRLSVADAVAVGPRNGFGEIAVVSQLTSAGVRTPRGGILVRQLGPAGDYRPGDFNPERLILDDVLAVTPTVNAGDEFLTDPVGVLDYGFGNFKMLVTANPGRVDNGLMPETTTNDGVDELSVATFNVENLSPLDTDAKVSRLATQIVTNLQAPDVIAIEEVQDNTGPTNDGVVAADQSWQRLIDAIVAAGGPSYSYRQIDPQNNVDGGAPGGNIRVGFLFVESDELAFVDRAGTGNPTTIDTDVVRPPRGAGINECGGRAQLTMSPGRVLDANLGGANAFNATRKSLAGEFCFRGETVFIVANHLSSKGDDRPLFGRFQPPFRLTEFQSLGTDGTEDGWRHAQAQAINDFVDEIFEVDKHAHVIVLGDINDFDFSETVEILSGERVALDPGPFMPDADGSAQTAPTGKQPVLTTLFDLLNPDERYSYVFDGNSQVLDQILVSRSLLKEGPAYDVLHVNAEFADQASDHDPSVMRVLLGDD